MASRTFIPTLVRLLHRVCVYIIKYKATIVTHMPSGGSAALDAIIVACEAFIALAPDDISS